MPDLDLLQITHHTSTAVSSTLPGIIFKIPGQDRSPTAKCLEHSQSHSAESIWHTNSESELSLVLQSIRHQAKCILSFLSPFLSVSPSFSLSISLSLIYIITFLWGKYGCSDIMGPKFVGKLSGKQHKLHFSLFQGWPYMWRALAVIGDASDVKGSNYVAAF